MNVVLYSTPTCPYCHQARSFLTQRGIRFTEYDVSRDQHAAAEMVRRTGQNGVPVIVVDNQTVVGFDRPRLEQLLRQASERRPSLGLRVADARSQASRNPALAGRSGAYVGSVALGSPAASAGIIAGDLVVAINGRPISGAADLQAAVGAGTRQMMLTIERGGRTQQVEVRI